MKEEFNDLIDSLTTSELLGFLLFWLHLLVHEVKENQGCANKDIEPSFQWYLFHNKCVFVSILYFSLVHASPLCYICLNVCPFKTIYLKYKIKLCFGISRLYFCIFFSGWDCVFIYLFISTRTCTKNGCQANNKLSYCWQSDSTFKNICWWF